MANFEGQGWSGNVGVRFVKTKEERHGQRRRFPTRVPRRLRAAGPCRCRARSPPRPSARSTSNVVANNYNDVLPSANFKFDARQGHGACASPPRARMARPDYSALGGSITADDTTLTGNGGNPNLKPIRSTNLDAAFEWYFAPRALLSAGVFYMDLKTTWPSARTRRSCSTSATNRSDTYTISAPINSKGKIKGFELAWQQPLADGLRRCRRTTRTPTPRRRTCPSRARLHQGPGGRVEEHVQPRRVLREPRFRRAPGVHLPLGVLRGPGPQLAAVPGRHRDARGVVELRRSTRTSPSPSTR